ncbi:MAG: DivIVA domain-containing protein, partial [bacterium]
MELSPLEIRSQKFSKKIKGYDVSEVDNFLEIVSKDMEKLYGEYYGLKEELVKKNQEIADYKEKDKSISEAILMVQSVSNDIKKAAVMEAEAIKRGAVAEAENI